jgi:hypothetical protein
MPRKTTAKTPEQVDDKNQCLEALGVRCLCARVQRCARILTAARREQIGRLNRETELKLAKRQAREDSEYVFGEGEGGFSGWSKCKERLDERIGDAITEPWTLHDFRRTFDTLGQDTCKIPPHITDVCLNRKGEQKKGVRKHYNFANYLEEKRHAMERWGSHIVSLVRSDA